MNWQTTKAWIKTQAEGYEKIWENNSSRINANQIAICVLFGLLGFMYAVAILVTHFFGNKPYGAFSMENKTELVVNLLSKRINILEKQDTLLAAKELAAHAEVIKNPTEQFKRTEEAAIIAKRKPIADFITASRKEMYLLKYHNNDTSMAYFSRYFYVDKKVLLSAIHGDWKDTFKYVSAQTVDTCNLLDKPPLTEAVRLRLVQKKSSQIMDFVGEYPIFGFWIVLSIAQMMLWFLVFPMLGANLLNLRGTLGEDDYKVSLTSRFINVLLPLVFVIVFCVAFYCMLADNYIITDQYFLSRYNWRISLYAIPGYLVATYCFASYLTLSNQFNNMNQKAVAAPSMLNNPEFSRKFLELKSAFENTFIISAIVLSLMILWSGVLVNALNSTEVFKFYAASAGQPLIPGDYVYLMALLHTMILLTFYIPVRLNFSSIQVSQVNALNEGTLPPKDMMETILGSLGSILVTTSPLIASLAQNLLHVFFK